MDRVRQPSPRVTKDVNCGGLGNIACTSLPDMLPSKPEQDSYEHWSYGGRNRSIGYTKKPGGIAEYYHLDNNDTWRSQSFTFYEWQNGG